MEKIREELKLQEWVDRIHDETYLTEIYLNINRSNFIFFSFKSGLYRDKTYPRMLIGEEPYIEPTKIERLALRETNKQQWVTEKVFILYIISNH